MEQVFMKMQKQGPYKICGHVSSGVIPPPTDELLVQSGLPNSLREFTCIEVTQFETLACVQNWKFSVSYFTVCVQNVFAKFYSSSMETK